MDEIAIVGVGCRFPGADNLREFWRVLHRGENHVKEIPRERWNVDAFYDPDPSAPGKTYVRKAGFVSGIDKWDSKFYGISDVEAEVVDPQQRLVLDCVHMALEDGGIMKKDIDGANIGVYIGSMTDDYKVQAAEDNTLSNIYTVTGTHSSIISARVSYAYNLTGPALTLDTACSSSLVAIDVASQALQTGKCTAAICGGVNVLLDPQMFVILSKARMLSPSGQCKTFTSEADGYARGEGCGIVILKTLHDAKQDGNKIWGTIKTGTNQDGHMTVPITAPSGLQQELLIKNLYEQHQVQKSRIRVIEAHGTGTPVGDPIEVNALAKHFGKTASVEAYIGSVKTNIGHLEAAGAMAGLIKVLLMMQHRLIVPSLWYNKYNENPKLNLNDKGFIVPTECITWQSNGSEKLTACVNSFGFGGTNAHAIVEEFVYPDGEGQVDTILPHIVTMSAYDEISLVEIVKNVFEHLNVHEYDVSAVSCTSTCKHDHKPLRKAVFGETQEALMSACKLYLNNPINVSLTSSEKKIIFVFCGVGTAWKGMCTNLMKIEVFRTAVQKVDAYLQKRVDWSISEKIRESNDFTTEAMVTHIAIFACQIGLAALWKHFGVEPYVVIGQSVGEVAAAHVAGYIDLKTAVRIIYYRSKYLSKVKEGSMAVIRNVDVSITEKLCKGCKGVSIAVYNSSLSCTVTGKKEDIDMFKKMLQNIDSLNPEIINLNVGCAYHSTYVNRAAKKLAKKVHIDVIKSKIPFISTVTGERGYADVIGTGEYWKQNIRQPVLFSKAVENAGAMSSQNIFLEIGPSPVLRSHIGSILTDQSSYSILSSMMKNKEITTLASTLCSLYENSVNLDWTRIHHCRKEVTDIPSNNLRKHRKLYQSQETLARIQGSYSSDTMHLYVRQTGFDTNLSNYQAEFDPKATAFIYEHVVSGAYIIPGATYADIGFVIGRNVFGIACYSVVVSLEFLRPMKVETGRKCVLYVNTIEEDKGILFHIKNSQNTICKGWVQPASKIQKENRIDIDTLKFNMTVNSSTHLNSDGIYGFLESMGFKYGECFQMMKHCDTNGEESVTEIEVPDLVIKQSESTIIHPCILDVMIQSTLHTIKEDSVQMIKTERISCLPVAIEEISVFRKPEKYMNIYTYRTNTTVLDTVLQTHYNVLLTTSGGFVVAEVRNFTIYGSRNDCKAPCELSYNQEWHQLRNFTPAECKEVNILALTNIYDDKMETLFCDCTHVCLFQNQKRMKVKEYIQEAIEFGFSKSQNIKNLSAVLLIVTEPPTAPSLEAEDSQEIHNHVIENCFIIVALLRHLTEQNLSVPVYIATQNAQKVASTSVKQTLTCGAIWGFVRSISLEFIYNEITLIDLQPSLLKTNETLIQLIFDTCQDVKALTPEIVIHRNTIYGAQFSKTKKSNHIPNVRAETRLLGSLRGLYKACSLSSDTENLVYLTEYSLEQEIQPKGNIGIQITSVYKHPVLISPRKTDRLTPPHQGPLKEDNLSILGIEYTGYKINRKSDLKVPSKDACSDTKKKVVCVYPTQVMTEVCVPKTCTVRLDNFPHYQPGTLLNTILSWKFSEYVPKHSNVLIYCENECKSLAMILKSVLCERRHSHVKGTKGDFKRDRKRGQNVLIIIGKMDSNFSLLSSCKLVIVLQGCLSEAVRQYFTFQRERELVCLNASDLLTEKNITICLRAIVPWLKSYHQEMSLKSKATKDLLLSATFPIVSYTSKMHTLTLQVVNDAVVNEACSSVKVT
ncbi:narbonolide/10-deoxymethynolide synthase PikA2, modules 3 and 4-like [Ruditapes philippinarum]|uniref:narbonolide/10-deoxymethynolide synthase PikA2, modules 3 and 4-like n=1 Tax=Ruditapes philippinarum TaxID=129788 RepID=UPI00295A76C6|nr:narbonolide/10-deoxymethynolide synthase PikA2, modules 3 and 4-like [Ruditapes philippinarum]